MNTTHETATTIDPFVEMLASTSRSPDINPQDNLYGFLVGSWELDLVAYPDDGNVTHSTGEAHFAWVLDGRAIQDVFINPQRSDRMPDSPKFGNWYGTTFRYFDPTIRALARVLVQSRRRRSCRVDRPPAWKRHRAGGTFPGRHADPLDVQRNHARLVSLARRTAGTRRQNMAAPGRIHARASRNPDYSSAAGCNPTVAAPVVCTTDAAALCQPTPGPGAAASSHTPSARRRPARRAARRPGGGPRRGRSRGGCRRRLRAPGSPSRCLGRPA